MRRDGASLDQIQDVYQRRLPALRRVAAAIVGDRDLACDVVQDAFVSAVRKRRTFSGRGSLEAWVWRIVVNAARDARVRMPRQELPEQEIPVEVDDPWRQRLIRAAVEQLPERQRLVLFLRVYADLNYRAIADAVGITEGTVGATLNAAHANLRETLSGVQL